MRKSLLFLFTTMALVALSAPPRVIVDMDIDSDVDDAGTLVQLYTMHNRRQIELVGVVVTSDDPYAATCVSAFNAHYGFRDLPIGFLEEQSKLTNHSRYTRQISEEFPHALASHQAAPTATTTYRGLLAKSPDASVVILTVGHLSSLQKLLQSGADDVSSLTGRELVEKKVVKWLCMGGQFPSGKEANFYRPDPASTVYCLANWPKPAVFCGWEIGRYVITGNAVLKAGLPSQSPLYRAYELYNNFGGRSSWDQVTAFLLADEAADYLELDNAGHCHVNEDGSNSWVSGPPGLQSYVKFRDGADKKKLAQKISDLMMPRTKARFRLQLAPAAR